ncbi:hypothetical protein M7I_5648 [Glarea lozoyensis 74030]|uniref:S-adenosyl-L-methionine-dependent methyltransferase n=1 Tax=Glarea lozoyensis (strain ATCC 74030 / MF5533) TaxID=1104152 RepID=H0ESG3_GLAL7|nr:hypothetical protein M7I_5648 [Glarea lozoyensis 74030]
MTSTSGLNDDNIIFAAGEKEVDRLQLQHEIMKDAMKDLIKAPLNLSKPGLQILDQATADGPLLPNTPQNSAHTNIPSGIWLKDVAAVSPAQHEYTGTDIEPYYPVPPPAHMTFFDQSMTKPWPAHMNATFDLVHSRLALPGAGITPIKTVVTQLIDLVKPGGWIQQTEMVYNPNAVKLSFEELDTLPERVLKELNEVGGYWQFFTIWGRKED